MKKPEKYEEWYRKGLEDAYKQREDADGCTGCAFQDVDTWELPCRQCKRGCKDYWRREKQ